MLGRYVLAAMIVVALSLAAPEPVDAQCRGGDCAIAAAPMPVIASVVIVARKAIAPVGIVLRARPIRKLIAWQPLAQRRDRVAARRSARRGHCCG